MLKLLFIVEGKENPWKYRFFSVFFAAHFITYIFVTLAKLELCHWFDGNCFLKTAVFIFIFRVASVMTRKHNVGIFIFASSELSDVRDRKYFMVQVKWNVKEEKEIRIFWSQLLHSQENKYSRCSSLTAVDWKTRRLH